MSIKSLSLCKVFFGGALVFGLLCFSSPAKASSCCAGAGGRSVCILNSDQKFQFGLASSYRDIGGHFDPYGGYTANPSGTESSVFTNTLGAAYRLTDDWQASLSIPVVRNIQTFSGVKRDATGIGDPIIEGRYLVWEDLHFLKFRPQLSIYGGAALPAGKSVYNSTDPYGTDVTGSGGTTLHLGANASKLIRPLSFSLDAGYFYPLAHRVNEMKGRALATPYDLEPGRRIQLSESVAYLFNEKWSSSLGIQQTWQFEAVVDGKPVAGSAARSLSSSVSVGYFHSSILGFTAVYDTPVPFSQFLVNQPEAQTISLSMIYSGL